MCNILSSLPESYNVLVTTLENHRNKLTSSTVCSIVITEYRKRIEPSHENNTEAVLRIAGSSVTKYGSSKNKTVNMNESKCLFCKRKGHWKKDCRKLIMHKEKKQN